MTDYPNFPLLPSGYFWRVYEGTPWELYADYVSIQKKRWMRPSISVQRLKISGSQGAWPEPSSISSAAIMCLSNWKKEDAGRLLYGDYLPKTTKK